jgi:hypothetical protein
MDKKIDLRILKTKKVLYDALEELMKNQSFEEIKVSDICSLALINRSTFYAHYTDKYELLEEYINTLKDLLEVELKKNKNIKNSKEYYVEMIKLLLNHIETKKDAYASIMINNKNSITMDILYDVINKDIIKNINEKDINNSEVPSDIISKFYCGAVFNICIEWIRYNKKYSIDDIVKYINILIPDDIK